MAIQPVRRSNISDQVFEQLKEQIITGEWKQGDKLPSENELAEQLGVSRVTVRHALQRLSALDLLETRVGEGTFIRTLDPGSCMNNMIPMLYLSENSLVETLEFRRVIEGSTAGLAAQKADADDILRLEELLRRMQESREDIKAFSQADSRFHKELGLITRNSLIIKTYGILEDLLKVAMEQIVSRRGISHGLYYHDLILQAIRDRDEQRCRQVMEEHIAETYDSMVRQNSNASPSH